MITGNFGTCNLCLGGDQNTANMWTSCLYNGFFTTTFRNCSNLCLFYYSCNYELSDAIYSSTSTSTYPRYNTSHTTTSNFGMGEVISTSYPFNWNFWATTGISVLTMTSPFSITRLGNGTQVIYGCEAVQFSSISSINTVNATAASGYTFTSWRVNGSGGAVASTNASFSPNYTTGYGLGTHYLLTWQFYATATIASSPPSVNTTSTTYTEKGSQLRGYGNVTSDGGATVTSRGFVVGDSNNTTPTLTNYTYIISGGSGTGTYNAATQVLVPQPPSYTTFYVRAYATNSAGTGYGSVLSQSTAIIP